MASPHSALTDRVFEKSGLSTLVKEFPAMIKEGMKASLQQHGEHSITDINRLESIIDSSVDTEKMSTDIRSHLAKGLNDQELTRVLQWFESPLGSKVVKLEAAASSADSFQKMSEQALSLQKKFRGTPREKLFNKFDRATRATEAGLETAMAVQRALVAEFTRGTNIDGDYNQLLELVEANRFMTRGVVGQQVFTGYLYTYQTLGVEEINDYIRFAETPSGSRFFRVANTAIQKALLAPSRAIGKKLFDVIGKKPD